MSKAFQLGDSNRCRTVYEQILRARVPKEEFDAQKLNKHVSVGRCRMLAMYVMCGPRFLTRERNK